MAGMLFRNRALLLEEEIKKRISPNCNNSNEIISINEEVNMQYKKCLKIIFQ